MPELGKRAPIGPVTLPSGKEIYFVEPLGQDRMIIMTQAIAQSRQAELMFMANSYWMPGKCLVDAEGQFVAPDYTHVFDDWSDRDVQFYRRVFDGMFGWSEGDELAAKMEASRFLPSRPTSSLG